MKNAAEETFRNCKRQSKSEAGGAEPPALPGAHEFVLRRGGDHGLLAHRSVELGAASQVVHVRAVHHHVGAGVALGLEAHAAPVGTRLPVGAAINPVLRQHRVEGAAARVDHHRRVVRRAALEPFGGAANDVAAVRFTSANPRSAPVTSRESRIRDFAG